MSSKAEQIEISEYFISEMISMARRTPQEKKEKLQKKKEIVNDITGMSALTNYCVNFLPSQTIKLCRFLRCVPFLNFSTCQIEILRKRYGLDFDTMHKVIHWIKN